MSHRSCPGKATPFRSFKLLQDFLRRRLLYTLFLLPNIKDVHPKTPCCHFQIRCRARSSVITDTMWELPKNSCGTISQGSLSPVGLEARLDRQHSSAQAGKARAKLAWITDPPGTTGFWPGPGQMSRQQSPL